MSIAKDTVYINNPILNIGDLICFKKKNGIIVDFKHSTDCYVICIDNNENKLFPRSLLEEYIADGKISYQQKFTSY